MNQQLIELKNRSKAFFEDVIPQMGSLCIQDLGNVNELGILLDKLDKLDKIDDEEPNYDEMSIPELAQKLKDMKSELDDLSAQKSELQKQYDFLSISVLPDRMDEEGIETLKIKNVGRLQASSDIRCSVPAKNKEALQEWLREHGHSSMISETVNASTLKAFVKEMMKEGKEWPEDLLNVLLYSRATVVKT